LLVLSLTMGLVSPQFHAKFDNEFDTVTSPKRDELPTSLWQAKCHFLKGEEINTLDQHIPTVTLSQPTPSDMVTGERDVEEEVPPSPTV
jgi:hypothetical protein